MWPKCSEKGRLKNPGEDKSPAMARGAGKRGSELPVVGNWEGYFGRKELHSCKAIHKPSQIHSWFPNYIQLGDYKESRIQKQLEGWKNAEQRFLAAANSREEGLGVWILPSWRGSLNIIKTQICHTLEVKMMTQEEGFTIQGRATLQHNHLSKVYNHTSTSSRQLAHSLTFG